jgi:hypothetical protein
MATTDYLSKTYDWITDVWNKQQCIMDAPTMWIAFPFKKHITQDVFNTIHSNMQIALNNTHA